MSEATLPEGTLSGATLSDATRGTQRQRGRDRVSATGWSLFGAGLSLLLIAPVAVNAGRTTAAVIAGVVLLSSASPLLVRRWRTREAPRSTPQPTAEGGGTGDGRVPTPVLAHEIRNPLAAAAGHLDLMADDPTLTEEQRRSLRTALRGVERASGLIGDYLENPDQWRPGSLFFDRTPVDLGEMLLEAMSEHAPMAAERRLTMSVDAPEQVLVRADSRRLRQVIDNLLSNAVKYNQVGGWIDVRLELLEEDGSTTVALEMSNPGTTLPEEDVAQVFDPHFRGSRAERLAAGHGIGLAVVHDIVIAHGGSITLDSCGTSHTTTVTMTLPG